MTDDSIKVVHCVVAQLMGTKLTDDELKAREDTVVLMETLIRDMEAMLYKDRSTPVGGGRIASKARAEMDKDRTSIKSRCVCCVLWLVCEKIALHICECDDLVCIYNRPFLTPQALVQENQEEKTWVGI